jgi:CRISPR-associated endonuclease/helicase Cas3
VSRLRAKSWDRSLGDPIKSVFLAQHLRDVAVCAEAIVDSTGHAQLSAFGIDSEAHLQRFRRLVSFAAICHDLGKANHHFQRMVADSPIKAKQSIRHEWLSWWFLRLPEMQPWITESIPLETREIDWAICLWAITGHHPAYNRSRPQKRPDGTEDLILFHCSHGDFTECLHAVSEIVGSKSMPAWNQDMRLSADDVYDSILDAHYDDSTLWEMMKNDHVAKSLLACVKNTLVASDVAGSSFPLQNSLENEETEWRSRINGSLSMTPTTEEISSLVNDRLTVNGVRNELRPFQRDVADLAGEITLVQAGCGSGKTLAAYHWAATRHPGKRLYICYPTTGTATEGFRDYLFDKSEHRAKSGAELFHGRATIDRDLILETTDDFDPDDSLSRIHSLRSWGVPLVSCTVDTVLSIICNHRKAIYSWPGICNAVFVFDEIHAYDSSLFGALLAFLRNLRGIPVLLMTASLPEHRLERLKSVAEDRGGLVCIPGPQDLEKLERYKQLVIDREEVVAQVQHEYESGGKVLWVSNTVDRTMSAYDQCRHFAQSNTVYHSRFRYIDRVRRHSAVIGAFQDLSKHAIAWTSQVAEMSLDLSCTLLVTELAPISALIQRLGRLNRRATRRTDLIRPFIVIEPLNKNGELAHLPYLPEELAEAKRWLSQLPSRISQADLVESWNKLESNRRESIRSDSSWIDGGFERDVTPLRDPGQGMTVLRECDRDDVIEGRRSILEVSIPMNQSYNKSIFEFPMISGAAVVPDSILEYNELTGGKWK